MKTSEVKTAYFLENGYERCGEVYVHPKTGQRVVTDHNAVRYFEGLQFTQLINGNTDIEKVE